MESEKKPMEMEKALEKLGQIVGLKQPPVRAEGQISLTPEARDLVNQLHQSQWELAQVLRKLSMVATTLAAQMQEQAGLIQQIRERVENL